MSGVAVTDYYAVLGIPYTATATEIESAYSALAQELHPDSLSEDATYDDVSEAESRFRAVSIAYETLSDPIMRALIDCVLGLVEDPDADRTPFGGHDIPAPEDMDIIIDGVTCRLEFRPYHWFTTRFEATLYVPFAQWRAVVTMPNMPGDVFFAGDVKYVDESGSVLVEGYSLDAAQTRALAYERHQAFTGQIAAVEERYRVLRQAGRPVDRLASAIASAKHDVEWMSEPYYYRRSSTAEKLHQAIRRAEREAERLEKNGSAAVLDALLEGRIYHPATYHNERIIKLINEYAIRTGGEVPLFTSDDLRVFYAKCLDGESDIGQLGHYGLELSAKEYVDVTFMKEMAAEGLLELAPDAIALQAKGGPRTYPLTYGVGKNGDEPEFIAVVRIPLSVYKTNREEYGKKSKFPELPHNIQLVIEVTVNDEVIAHGKLDVIASKVKKYEGGAGRSKFRADHASIGSLMFGTDPGEVPPWFKGKVRKR